jgi:hypothetical protein
MADHIQDPKTGRLAGSIGCGRDTAPASPRTELAALHAARDRAFTEQTDANWEATRDQLVARYGLGNHDIARVSSHRQAHPGVWTGTVTVRGRRLRARTILGTTERALYRHPLVGRPLTREQLADLVGPTST